MPNLQHIKISVDEYSLGGAWVEHLSDWMRSVRALLDAGVPMCQLVIHQSDLDDLMLTLKVSLVYEGRQEDGKHAYAVYEQCSEHPATMAAQSLAWGACQCAAPPAQQHGHRKRPQGCC